MAIFTLVLVSSHKLWKEGLSTVHDNSKIANLLPEIIEAENQHSAWQLKKTAHLP